LTKVKRRRASTGSLEDLFGCVASGLTSPAHGQNVYGASPLRAEIVRTKKAADQTFAMIKFVFPRGDATSLLFGFDAAGKITGVAVGGMAGD